jgi:hypothetical protein
MAAGVVAGSVHPPIHFSFLGSATSELASLVRAVFVCGCGHWQVSLRPATSTPPMKVSRKSGPPSSETF